jgi:hypothetical protein
MLPFGRASVGTCKAPTAATLASATSIIIDLIFSWVFSQSRGSAAATSSSESQQLLVHSKRFVYAICARFVACSFRGLFACVLSWVEILHPILYFQLNMSWVEILRELNIAIMYSS